ncbi:MAG: hypothetical protein AAF533_28555 [Acidobacteriota bacterium]
MNRPPASRLTGWTTALAAACLALSAQAQVTGLGTSGGGTDPYAEGEEDGRLLGIRQGQTSGRSHRLFLALQEGFAQGLTEAARPGQRESLTADQGSTSRDAGREAGLERGTEAGREAALRAWLDQGRAPGRATAPPPPELSAADAGFEGPCPPSDGALMNFNGSEVRLDIGRLDEGQSPFEKAVYEPPYPPEDDLRRRGRFIGLSNEDLEQWIRDYRFAFQAAYIDSYTESADTVPAEQREDFLRRGRTLGRNEGARRLTCEVAAAASETAWREGLAEGWRDGFETSHAEAVEQSRRRAVVVVDGSIRDASGDGLLQPGEAAVLELELCNASSNATDRSSGSWQALRGLSKQKGYFDGGLQPGECRNERVELGPTAANAPAGTKVVVLTRGMGNGKKVLTADLQWPLRLGLKNARLTSSDGVLHVTVQGEVERRATADAHLRDAAAGKGVPLPAGSEEVSVSVPVALTSLATHPAAGVLELTDATGRSWQRMSWSSELTLAEAVPLVAGLSDPVAAVGQLTERLVATLETSLGGGAEAEQASSALEAYGQALDRLRNGAARNAFASVVEPVLLARLAEDDVPKSLRKRWRRQLSL